VAALRTSWGRTLLVAAVAGLVLLSLPGATRAAAATSTAGPVVYPCAGTAVPSSYNGTFAVEGGPEPANGTAHVPLTVSFSTMAAIEEFPGGGLLSETCRALAVNVTTGADGAFAFLLSLPPTVCTNGTPEYCTSDLGLYGPVEVTPSEPPPAGYALSTEVANGSVSLAWVALLASVRTDPATTGVSISDGASASLTASAWAGNNTPCPLAVTYHWSVNGTGWLAAAGNGSTEELFAGPAAGAGNVSLFATAEAGESLVASPATTVRLFAVPTEVASTAANRSEVDAGDAVRATVVGTGAANYSYRATFVPGLGRSSATVDCAAVPTGSGRATVTCATALAYPTAGTAHPTVSVTNGFSAANATLPEIDVEPPAALSIAPSVLAGYAGLPLPITVSVAAGTGVGPFARACLDDGVGPVVCSSLPGPSWSFDPTFPTAGRFPIEAWAIDGVDANRSVDAQVEVEPPLEVGPLTVNAPAPTAGAPVDLSGRVSGGDPPLRFWWNVSGENGSVASGFVETDGNLTAAFVPASSGVLEGSLTVVDSLGTVAERTVTIEVAPAPAVSVEVALGPPAGPAVAGAAVPVAWTAADRSGAPVAAFAAPVEVGLFDANASPVGGWVNSSALGALAPLGGGWFDAPAAAWADGRLDVTVAATRAGVVYVRLVGPALPDAPAAYPIAVGPDLDRLVLFAPEVVHAGLRSNATFWHARDPFGNGVPGAEVVVEFRSSLGISESLLTAEPAAGGGTGLWLNFSAPGPDGGTLTVLDASHHVLLGPFAVPAVAAAPAPDPSVVALSAAVPAGAVGGALAAFVRRRRRAGPSPDAEAAVCRFAEGEGQVVEIVRRAGAAGFAELEAAWTPGPAPPELADWVAALVADGSLSAALGPDGVARFRISERPTSGPRVTVDPAAFDAALARRERETTEAGEGTA
jgi:hypothetical protein